MSNAIDPITAMKGAIGRGQCPTDCLDQRGGPHWHNYLDALREAGFQIVSHSDIDAERVAPPSRARNLTRSLFDKVAYECKRQGIALDRYDGDFIMAVMLEWLEANDAALTKTGVKRYRR